MSWSARYVYGDDEGITATGDMLKPEVADQFDWAVASINTIIQSGSLGSPNGKYNIVISGHANPDHEPVEGWSNDHLTISISQI